MSSWSGVFASICVTVRHMTMTMGKVTHANVHFFLLFVVIVVFVARHRYPPIASSRTPDLDLDLELDFGLAFTLTVTLSLTLTLTMILSLTMTLT